LQVGSASPVEDFQAIIARKKISFEEGYCFASLFLSF